MGPLSELTLRTSYHKGRDDIADDFYLPCMRRSIAYDRAVGYFRSAIFLIAWSALRDFVQRNGKIRILCSQVLAAEDVDALEEGYSARADQSLAARLADEVRSLLRDDLLGAPARVLAALVARGTLEFQIAVLRGGDTGSARARLFHDKLGIFRDDRGNVVIFKGSMNETWSGLASDGNLESVDVAASWMGARDLERTRNEDSYFSDLWSNRYPTLLVRPFPEVARVELERAAEPDWESSLQELLEKVSRPEGRSARGRTLLPHQAAGLASWKANGRKGILEFATGSGKTFTAITAIRCALQEHRQPVVVIVPDQVLFAQWYAEIESTTADLGPRILRVGAGYDGWRNPLSLWTVADESPRIVLATVQSAASDDFRSRICGGPHLMLVADEVHRLGSPHHQNLLDPSLFGPRLGLSATPERAGDLSGTARLLEFFGGILEPRYTLSNAIRDRVLCPYFYRPHTVELSEDEAERWQSMTTEISRILGRLAGGDDARGLQERVHRLLIKRARVVKQAEAKVDLVTDVLREEWRPDQRWIVYCDDLTQLERVSRSLLAAGIQSMPFHSKMQGDRGETLKWLARRGGIVVAIKCLDEGVDIPSVTHAFILASSKNPREFVQRRGRVLRKAEGKALAYIHDAIVLPPKPSAAIRGDAISSGELARAVQFAMHAENAAAASDLQQIAVRIGMDWRSLIQEGVEDEDD